MLSLSARRDERHGLVVVFRGHDPEAVRALQSALRGLPDGAVSLARVPGIQPVDRFVLIARAREHDRGVVPIGLRTRLWELSPARWERVIALLSPFTADGSSPGPVCLDRTSGVSVYITADELP